MSLLEISYAEDLAQNPEQVPSLMSYQAKRRVFFLETMSTDSPSSATHVTSLSLLSLGQF